LSAENDIFGGQSWSDPDKLRRYISYCRRIDPSLSADSRRILGSYYQLQRKTDARNAARTTIRMLESLIRLGQAHARLMMRSQVTVQDSIMAILVVEHSMMGVGLNLSTANQTTGCGGGVLHASFHSDPDSHYREIAPRLLQKLGLSDLPYGISQTTTTQ
jgi:DNA helicase MCM9